MDVRQPAVVEYQEPGSQAVNQESASQPVVLKQESDCGLKPPSTCFKDLGSIFWSKLS